MTITDDNTIITGIRDHDSDIIATTLLNVCIMAADRRGGRRMFNVGDFNAFKAMLEIADGIGPIKTAPRKEAIQSGVDAVSEAIGAQLPPNTM